MYVARYAESRETLEQLGGQVEIRLVDEFAFGFEGIAAVADTIEDGARLEAIEQLVAIGIHQKVDDDGMALGHTLEPPRRRVKDGAGGIIPMREQRA